MKTDRIEKIAHSTIQHGKFNDRIYLVKLDQNDLPDLIGSMKGLAERHSYSKIFAKVPSALSDEFIREGYCEEAKVVNYYNGREDASFLGLFLDPDRGDPKDQRQLKKVLETAQEKHGAGNQKKLRSDATIRPCTPSDVDPMSRIYREVFPSYPFPVDDPDYLLETMQSHIAYFGVEIDNQLVALSSAEMDRESANAEMTDFATLPDWLGNGFAIHLLEEMERELVKRKIKTSYTIARAASFGMNITFSKLGYNFGGRLINNTNISGSIESMNVWFKPVGN